ncbi:MAG TPA: tetratricopeptide repeat protein, partial [bacterium]|nr:tetratricopeptide repeat protein [bacterium]
MPITLYLPLFFLLASCAGPLSNNSRGDLFYSQAQYDKSAAEYRKNIRYYQSIHYPLYMLNLAVADYRSGNLDEAERAFLTALKLSHGENLGVLEKNFGFLAPKSETTYKLRDFEEVMVHFYLGLIYLEQDRLDDAAVEFKKILLLDPEYPLMQYVMAKNYELRNEYEEAEIAYRKAAEYRSGFPYPYLDAGLIFQEKGWAEEAQKAMSKYAALDGESRTSQTVKQSTDVSAFQEDIFLIDLSFSAQKIKKEEREKLRYKVSINGETYGFSYLVENLEFQKMKDRIRTLIKDILKDTARAMIIKNIFK